MESVSLWITAYTRAARFVDSGAIQRSFLCLMRLLQLAWTLSIACLFTVIMIQVLLGVVGYSLQYDMLICSDIETVVMSAILFTYPPFFVLRAILIMASPDYVPIGDYLDHLMAKRLFCILLMFCSRSKPINQAGLAICVVSIECEIDKVRRHISARDKQ
jgi:hypothetical protein